MTADDVGRASNADLADLVRGGTVPDARSITGDWRGTSLGLPAVVDRVAWKVFRKSFRADGDGVRGFNVRVEQRPGPTVALRRGGRDVTFGPFQVATAADTPFGPGLLLDYGATHRRWHPLARVRDVLVALGPELLVGATWLELGPVRIRTPSFFTLEREG